MKLREHRINDIKKILKIEKEVFPDPLSGIVFLFFSVFANIYVAEEGKRIIGFLVLGYENPRTPFIYRIGVSARTQSKGVGSQLLEKYVTGECSVATMKSNTKAIRFYEKNGFKICEKFQKKGGKKLGRKTKWQFLNRGR